MSKPVKAFFNPCGQATSGSLTVIGGGIGLLNRSSPGIARPLHFIVVELAILFNGRLGWMERSDPHQFRFVVVTGFARA
jgi:hypothetical protein